jgi:hypothetical protein
MTARDSLFISVFVAYVLIISIISISFNPFIHTHTIFHISFFLFSSYWSGLFIFKRISAIHGDYLCISNAQRLYGQYCRVCSY